MELVTSNSAGTKEWISSIQNLTLSTYVEIPPDRLILAAPDAERRDWSSASLEGLERWETKHGLSQDE